MSPEILNFATDDRMPERSVSPTKEEVIQRVDDWLARLKILFDRIEEWAKGREFDIGRGETVQMHEELMRIRGLQSALMPVLRVDGRGGYALFKPKGLWVIGANGRIDVYTSKGVYALLDQASKLDAPHWTIHRNGDPLDGSDFEPGIIEQIL